MVEGVGLSVVNLQRVSFAGITLKGLSPGTSVQLNEKEMKIIRSSLLSEKVNQKKKK
jgi:16S rRNA U516 pseudouridylate synthase RsuA-like enzyme